MAKTKDIHNPESVTAFIQNLQPSLAEVVQAVRQLILNSSKQVGEQIKWNSPSFFYTGEIKAFDAKEYKRDIAVIHTQKGYALIIFPTGAMIQDTTGLLQGDYKDGRRLATFKNMDDVDTKGKHLQKVIRQWLALVEK